MNKEYTEVVAESTPEPSMDVSAPEIETEVVVKEDVVETAVTTASTTVETTSSTSPKDAHFDRLEAKIDECSGLGSLLVVAVSSEGDSEEDEDRVYTEEQMQMLRHIIITKSRANELEKAQDFVTLGQSGGFAMYNTSSGNTSGGPQRALGRQVAR